MKTSKGRSLERLHNKAQAKRAAIEAKRLAIAGDDNPFGTPIDYRHLSNEQLETEYNKAIAAIPVSLDEYAEMDISDLIRTYTELLANSAGSPAL